MPSELLKFSGLVFLLFPVWGVLVPILFRRQKNELGRTMADSFYQTYVLEWVAFIFISLLLAGGTKPVGTIAADIWRVVGFYYAIFTIFTLGGILWLYLKYYYPEEKMEPFVLAFWAAVIPAVAMIVILIVIGFLSVFTGFV